MAIKENIIKALQDIRKQSAESPRKFKQSVDLIINLREIDLKKNPINVLVDLDHRVKDKKIAAFLEKKTKIVDTIAKSEFDAFKDKKKMKKLIKEYDFFIAHAKLMPAVATDFGRVLGPAGKMPSPQLGVLIGAEDDDNIKQLVDRINSVVKIKPKEPSIKVAIGNEVDKDENLADNATSIYNEVFKLLPEGRENVRSVMIKFTMSKPVKVSLT